MLEERTLATAASDEVHNPLPGPNVLGRNVLERNAISSGNENWKDTDTKKLILVLCRCVLSTYY